MLDIYFDNWVCTCPDLEACPYYGAEDPPDCASCVYLMDLEALSEVSE